MSKKIESKPEWGAAIEFPGGHAPSFVYDRSGLPCGFALFTTKQRADIFLGYKKGTKGVSFRLGADHSLMDYQSWAVKFVQVLLHQMGKELNIEEVGLLVYTRMPVFVDVKTPHLSCEPKLPSFFHLVRDYFTKEQCEEVIAKAELVGWHYLSREKSFFTLAKYTKGGKFFGLCREGEKETNDEFLDSGLRLGVTVHVTKVYKTEAEVVAEAWDWIVNRNIDPLTRDIPLGGGAEPTGRGSDLDAPLGSQEAASPSA